MGTRHASIKPHGNAVVFSRVRPNARPCPRERFVCFTRARTDSDKSYANSARDRPREPRDMSANKTFWRYAVVALAVFGSAVAVPFASAESPGESVLPFGSFVWFFFICPKHGCNPV